MAPKESQLWKKRNLENDKNNPNTVPRESVQRGSAQAKTKRRKAGQHEERKEDREERVADSGLLTYRPRPVGGPACSLTNPIPPARPQAIIPPYR